jgi:hypothetical protein
MGGAGARVEQREVPRSRYSNRRVTVVFEPPSNAQVGWLALADVQPVFIRNGF